MCEGKVVCKISTFYAFFGEIEDTIVTPVCFELHEVRFYVLADLCFFEAIYDPLHKVVRPPRKVGLRADKA